MANKEHLQPLIAAIVSMNMASWNQWRMENPEILPDLLGVELSELNLSFANLSSADLSHSNLSGTNLHRANLRKADLSRTSLRKADLSEADLSYAVLKDADLRLATLRNAMLRGANLRQANVNDADLRGVNLTDADLTDAEIDLEVLERPKNWLGEGLSRLEKMSLELFGRRRLKERQVRDARAEPPPRQGKRL